MQKYESDTEDDEHVATANNSNAVSQVEECSDHSNFIDMPSVSNVSASLNMSPMEVDVQPVDGLNQSLVGVEVTTPQPKSIEDELEHMFSEN